MSRQIGTDVSPICYREIKAYCDVTGAIIDGWEAKALVQADHAIRRVRPKRSDPKMKERASKDDAEGVKSVMAGLGKTRTVVRKRK